MSSVAAKKGSVSTECVEVPVTWETVDPQTGYAVRTTVTPCRRYQRWSEFREGAGRLLCEAEMLPPGKGNMFNVGDLRAALAHSDVVAALQRAPITFFAPEAKGPFRLIVGDKQIEVSSAAGGTPLPAGVASALSLLRSLDVAYENNNPACKPAPARP